MNGFERVQTIKTFFKKCPTSSWIFCVCGLILLQLPIVTAHAQITEIPTVERSVYLNGIDVSSTRNQRMNQVDLHIDEKGNIFITAPHYEVLEEGSYIPLSTWARQTSTASLHKSPGQVMPQQNEAHSDLPQVNTGDSQEVRDISNVPIEKPGTDWPDASSN